jgi:hypothetical protein
MDLYVNTTVDFYMKEFKEPVDQDVYGSSILWAGNLVIENCKRQGKMTAVTS